jgi:hypothetical protein
VSYDYTAYGLSLRSDVPLPGLKPATSVAATQAISLVTKVKPEWVEEASKLSYQVIYSLPAAPECSDPAFVAREHEGGRFYQLSYSDGTEFFVDSGATTLWGSCPAPLTIEDLATYLLGPVMGFILRRRGGTPLHASSVCVGEVALVISGPAAAGKSTTAAALALRGAPALCEDIAALHESEGRFYIQPGYPRVCLWPDSVEKLYGSKEALPQLTPNWEKKFLALDGERAKFEAGMRPLGGIYLLGQRTDEDTAPRLEEITPRDTLLELVQNTYMNMLLTREQRAAEFELLSRLVNQVPSKRVIPHKDAARIEALCELLEADARKIVTQAPPPMALSQN